MTVKLIVIFQPVNTGKLHKRYLTHGLSIDTVLLFYHKTRLGNIHTILLHYCYFVVDINKSFFHMRIY